MNVQQCLYFHNNKDRQPNETIVMKTTTRYAREIQDRKKNEETENEDKGILKIKRIHKRVN